MANCPYCKSAQQGKFCISCGKRTDSLAAQFREYPGTVVFLICLILAVAAGAVVIINDPVTVSNTSQYTYRNPPRPKSDGELRKMAIEAVQFASWPSKDYERLHVDTTTQKYETSIVMLDCNASESCYDVSWSANTMPQAEVVPITCKWRVVIRDDNVASVEASNTEARTLFVHPPN